MTYEKYRLRIATKLNIVLMNGNMLCENSCILFLALDDTLNEMKRTGEKFSFYLYMNHVKEYDIPYDFNADFIIDIMNEIHHFDDTTFDNDRNTLNPDMENIKNALDTLEIE